MAASSARVERIDWSVVDLTHLQSPSSRVEIQQPKIVLSTRTDGRRGVRREVPLRTV
jgi:hypothetical protein